MDTTGQQRMAAAEKLFPYQKILVVRDQGIGNMVMLTPALKALKVQLPDSEITVFGKSTGEVDAL